MKKKFHIGIFSEPGKAGVKRHVIDILNNVDLSLFSVFFIYSLQRSDDIYSKEIEKVKERGINCYEVKMGREINIFNDLKAFGDVAKIIYKEKPALLHLHASKAGFIGRFAAKVFYPKCKTLFTPNVISSFFSKKYIPLEFVASFLTDWIIASCASEAKDFLALKFFPKEKILALPLCVDSAQVALSQKANKTEAITITSCGRISFQKNALLFFKVAKLVSETMPEIKFVWIGDFDQDEEAVAVKKFLKENPMNNYEITGWVNNATSLIGKSDLFLMLSRYESFGYVNADAQSAGVPVIATDTTGNRDLIINGLNGYIITEDPKEIAEKILHLATDSKKRKLMARHTKNFIQERFDLKYMISGINKIYLEVCNDNVVSCSDHLFTDSKKQKIWTLPS